LGGLPLVLLLGSLDLHFNADQQREEKIRCKNKNNVSSIRFVCLREHNSQTCKGSRENLLAIVEDKIHPIKGQIQTKDSVVKNPGLKLRTELTAE